MNFYQQLVKQKLKTITPEELAAYSRDYGLPITVSQAKKFSIWPGRMISTFSIRKNGKNGCASWRKSPRRRSPKKRTNCFCNLCKKSKKGRNALFYCSSAAIFSSNRSSKVFARSIAISCLYGGFLLFFSSPTYGVSKIFGISSSCG